MFACMILSRLRRVRKVVSEDQRKHGITMSEPDTQVMSAYPRSHARGL